MIQSSEMSWRMNSFGLNAAELYTCFASLRGFAKFCHNAHNIATYLLQLDWHCAALLEFISSLLQKQPAFTTVWSSWELNCSSSLYLNCQIKWHMEKKNKTLQQVNCQTMGDMNTLHSSKVWLSQCLTRAHPKKCQNG